jgi:hypothetical protein
MRKIIWLLRYAAWCVFILRSSPRISWEMAEASYEEMSDMTPREAFEEEISRWSDN